MTIEMKRYSFKVVKIGRVWASILLGNFLSKLRMNNHIKAKVRPNVEYEAELKKVTESNRFGTSVAFYPIDSTSLVEIGSEEERKLSEKVEKEQTVAAESMAIIEAASKTYKVWVPKPTDSRKKYWCKLLTGVDKKLCNGYCFEGEFLPAGELVEVSVGSFLLCYDRPGSVKNWHPQIRLFQVVCEEIEGVFKIQKELVFEWEGFRHQESWALCVRDDIAEIINEYISSYFKERQFQKELEIVTNVL